MAMVMTMTTSMVSASNNHNWKKQTPMPEPPKQEVCHECGRKIEMNHGHETDTPRMEQPKQKNMSKNSKKDNKNSKKNVKQQSFGNGTRSDNFGGNR